MKNYIFPLICVIFFDCPSFFAQIGQVGVDYPSITNKHLAVFIIDFPDAPKSIKDNYYPTIASLKDTIFNGSIRKYLTDMSYGQFTLTGDVFGYFTHQNPGFVNGVGMAFEDVMEISTITIPGFDINNYDGVLVVSINDAALAGGRFQQRTFLLNGKTVTKSVVFVPIHIGFFNRDGVNYPITNTLNQLMDYNIPINTDSGIEGTSTIIYSRFNRTLSHEFGHFLGVGHATSRTNGTSYDHEPEEPNNNCNCFASDTMGSLLTWDYGNKFDVMGLSEYGMSLNMAFRDRFGWTNSANRYSIKNYGHFTTTISPLNSLNGIRAVEIRVPFKYISNSSFKNKGYFLEVRTGNDKWDKMLLHPQLKGNNDGIMVMKTDGLSSELLDMSPSPNISYYGQIVSDIRDVVLKPGMVYDNSEIRLSNIKKNADGSFTIDIDIYDPLFVITADGPTTFCSGDSVRLSWSYSSGNQWYKNGLIIPGATSSTYMANASGVYTDTVTNTGGVKVGSTGKTVTVNPLPPTPTITAGTATTFCSGGNVTLISNATKGNQWHKNGVSINSSTGATLNVTASGRYTVKITLNGCESAVSNAIVVTQNPIPSAPVITVSTPTTFCQGGSVTLTSNVSNDNQWYKDGAAISGSTGTTLSVIANGSYTLKTTLNGCESSFSNAIIVVVNPVPALPAITADNPTIFCAGGSVTLTSNAVSGNQWFKDGTAISGSTGATLNVAASGSFTVKVTANACESAESNSIAVTVNSIPPAPTITQNANQLVSSAASGNQWYLNNVIIAGATGQNYTPTASGNYTVQVTSNNCVSAFSNAVAYIFTSIQNIDAFGNQVKVVPNPVEDKLIITRSDPVLVLNIQLFDINGRRLDVFTSSLYRTEIDMTKYAAGLYIIRIEDRRNKILGKKIFVKLK